MPKRRLPRNALLGEPRPNAAADAEVAAINGGQAEGHASIVTTREQADGGFEPAASTPCPATHCFDQAALVSKAAPGSQAASVGPREANAAPRRPADRSSSLVETDPRDPGEVGQESEPPVGATDETRERVDVSEPAAERPQADRGEDARSSCQVGDGGVLGLDALQGDADGVVDPPPPEASTPQVPAIDAVPPEVEEAAKKRIVDDQLGDQSKRTRTKVELLSSTPTRGTDGYVAAADL